MHVDGFRFDLAPVLARELYEVNRLGTFFDIIQQDPVLSQVKLIAEPWDVGPGGYQVGNFPVGWAEWNDRYRDCVRRFWHGEPGQLPELASRLSGSSDLYAVQRARHVRERQLRHRARRLHARRPRELRAQAQRGERRGQPRRHQRQLQQELGRRGPDRHSSRCSRCAQRTQRNLIATLFFSQGVRMLLARRRDGPDAARQQQRVLPGQRDQLGRLGADARRTATCSSSRAA